MWILFLFLQNLPFFPLNKIAHWTNFPITSHLNWQYSQPHIKNRTKYQLHSTQISPAHNLIFSSNPYFKALRSIEGTNNINVPAIYLMDDNLDKLSYFSPKLCCNCFGILNSRRKNKRKLQGGRSGKNNSNHCVFKLNVYCRNFNIFFRYRFASINNGFGEFLGFKLG